MSDVKEILRRANTDLSFMVCDNGGLTLKDMRELKAELEQITGKRLIILGWRNFFRLDSAVDYHISKDKKLEGSPCDLFSRQ